MIDRSRVALLLAVFAAIGLVISSGAVAWVPGAPTDGLGEDVKLQATSDYAYIDGNEQLVIDISDSNDNLTGAGLNPGAEVLIEDVAALNYTGSDWARVYINQSPDGIEVQVDGTPIESPENNVTLDPNERVGLDLVINTSGETDFAGTQSIEIHARVPETDSTNFFGGVTVLDTEQTEEVTMTVTVLTPEEGVREIVIENMTEGDQIDTPPFNLPIGENGTTLDGLELTAPEDGNATVVMADTNETLPEEQIETATNVTPFERFLLDQESGPQFDTFTFNGTVPDSAIPEGTERADLQLVNHGNGTWQLVDTEQQLQRNGTVKFTASTDSNGDFAIAAPIPQIEVVNVSVDNTTLDENGNLTMIATVTNHGTATGNETIPLMVANETVEQIGVTVPPDETIQVATDIPMTETGNFTVAVGSVEFGEVTVRNQTGPVEITPRNTTDENDTTPLDDAEPTTVTTTETTPEPTTESPTPTTTEEPVEEVTTTPEPDPVEEPAGIQLEQLLGLSVAAILGGALITLVRRVSV